METCSFLYHEGAKIVLQNPVKLVGSEEEALAVLRFVQVEDLLRCCYVLADLVPCMTRLQRLNLRGEPERMFVSYPHFLPTFAGLRSLKALVIWEVGERCSEMLRTLQSKLIIASVQFPPTGPHDVRSELALAATSHPVLTLKRSASSLEELTCGCLFHTIQGLVFSHPTIIYPKLHALALYDRFALNTIPFIKVFPNLIAFHPFFENQRKANLDLQKTSRYGQPFAWKRLREFRGHLIDLWVLGITCPIASLFLQDAPALHPPTVLTDVLAYARPVALAIDFGNSPLTDVFGGGFLLRFRATVHLG